MLVLSRKVGESVIINGNVKVTVLESSTPRQIRLGVSAPSEVEIHREEIWEKIQKKEKSHENPTDN